MNCKRKVSQST